MDRVTIDALRATAFAQHGVVSRRQLYARGVTRSQLRAQVRAQRWEEYGHQTIAMQCGDLSPEAFFWYAVFEAGPSSAVDGVSALKAAGLKGFHTETVRVSVPRGARVVRRKGLRVRQTRRLRRSDIVATGLPRVRTEIAAVRAALWATSNRQAATILAMTMQQRLATAEAIGRALLDVRRDKRRRYLEGIVLDLLDGAQALGELDFARLCRQYGLPKPDRQQILKSKRGRVYLDVRWNAFGLVVEIDGIQHDWVQTIVGDALRHNDVTLEANTVLRLPLLGLRVAEADFMDQIRRGLVAAGWNLAA